MNKYKITRGQMTVMFSQKEEKHFPYVTEAH